MRFVVFGAGAIGGVVGARLSQAGREVVLIARGPHYETIAAGGLVLETPRERVTLRMSVVRGPEEVSFAPEDIVLLAVKSQDTGAALAAPPPPQPPRLLSASRTASRTSGSPCGSFQMSMGRS